MRCRKCGSTDGRPDGRAQPRLRRRARRTSRSRRRWRCRSQSLREGARARRLPIAPARLRRDGALRVRRDAAAQRCRRLRDVPGAGGRRADHAGSRDPCAVRHPVRLDRVVVREHARRRDRAGDAAASRRSTSIRRRRCPRSRRATALLLPTYNEDAGSRDSRACRRSTSPSAATGAAGQFDIFILSDTTDPDIFIAEEARLPGAAPAAPGCDAVYLSPPSQERCQEGRQHRRMGAPLRRPLRADDRARRRLADDRRHAGAARCRDGEQSRRRPDPDLPGDGQRDHAVRARAAVRRPALRPADRLRACLVARRRQQLLGTQRRASARALSRTAAGLPVLERAAPDRRAYPEPRLRRGGADAARRLGDPHGAGARRLVRGIPALAHRICGARPALVPGQPAARRRVAGARPALGEPAASLRPASAPMWRRRCGSCSCSPAS